MKVQVISGDGVKVHETLTDAGVIYTVGVDRKWLETKINKQVARMALELLHKLEDD